jgi:hypothetical protein
LCGIEKLTGASFFLSRDYRECPALPGDGEVDGESGDLMEFEGRGNLSLNLRLAWPGMKRGPYGRRGRFALGEGDVGVVPFAWVRGARASGCDFGYSTVMRVAAVVPVTSAMGVPTPTASKVGGQSLKSKVPEYDLPLGATLSFSSMVKMFEI